MATQRKNNEVITDVPSTKRGLKEGYDRVTFIVKEETIYKLAIIAKVDEVFLKEVVNNALETYVAGWEKKHPNKKIPKREKK
jgi:hypothetical protein